MRTIKFRGKAYSSGGWVYGYYFYDTLLKSHWIGCDDDLSEVDPETVGQFTGLLDKNGKEIFEGDVLKGGIYKSYIVKWDNEENGFNVNYHALKYEVIGNIFDNPELLKN